MLICILASSLFHAITFERYFKNKASVALNPLVSLIGRLFARSSRKRGNRQTDRQNDKTTTVTLAAHARRGLTMKGTKVQTLGARAVGAILMAMGTRVPGARAPLIDGLAGPRNADRIDVL